MLRHGRRTWYERAGLIILYRNGLLHQNLTKSLACLWELYSPPTLFLTRVTDDFSDSAGAGVMVFDGLRGEYI